MKPRKPSLSKNVILGLNLAKGIINQELETMASRGLHEPDVTKKSRQLRSSVEWIDRTIAWYWNGRQDAETSKPAHLPSHD